MSGLTVASKRPWQLAPSYPEVEQSFVRELEVPPAIARILAGRGFDSSARAREFLHPSLDSLHDPSLLPDYDRARAEILGAISRKEKIYVHGDYDVDGVTSAAILTRFLRAIGGDVAVHVPHRQKEGYGIHQMAINEAKEMGAHLFLTCDCGISAQAQVEAAKEAGMRVVVTDHHEPGPVLPKAHAVVNPHREDSTYPFKNLSGAGVAFKLCAGLTRDLQHPVEGFYRAYLDLVTLGTVADVMPLVDENRILVRHGLERIRASQKPGLQELLRVAFNEIPNTLKSDHVGFQIGPRLNAAGRLDDASLSLQLLMEKDRTAARELALRLNEINDARKLEQSRIVDQAVEMVRELELDKQPILVVSNPGWPSGIIGLVAGKLLDTFERPTFVISYEEGSTTAKGSARSLPGFHLAEAIHGLHTICSGGGHELAAGIGIEVDRIAEFKQAVNALAQEIGYVPAPAPLHIDAEVTAEEVDLDVMDEYALLEPFGAENPRPTFVSRRMRVESKVPLSNGKHTKMILRSESGTRRDLLAWNRNEDLGWVEPNDSIDVAYEPSINEFNGNRSVQWKLVDLATSG